MGANHCAMPVAKHNSKLTLKDRLSRLTLRQAEKLLGPDGKRLIMDGGKMELDPTEDVLFDDDYLMIRWGGLSDTAAISLDPARQGNLLLQCSSCHPDMCEHLGMALSFVLEEKTFLGLAVAPVERASVESLSEQELVDQALAEREKRAAEESMRVVSQDRSTPWADYLVTSAASGRTYRVALRGMEHGDSFCTCPDYRKNTLGTCKHVLHTLEKVRKKFSSRKLATPWQSDGFYVSVRYGVDLGLCLEAPGDITPAHKKVVRGLIDKTFTDAATIQRLLNAIRQLERSGTAVTIYPDAEEMISRILHEHRVEKKMQEIRKNPATHSLRNKLLKTELLPYQLDGIAFATCAGRSILADDMGLGKTIQGIGVGEMLAREVGIKRVLIVCPASLKSQWALEIEKFSWRDAQIVVGPYSERGEQYREGAFFTICNYEQVLRDHADIDAVPWDLIILDEAQRIKNWEAKTTAMIKSLRSKYALVLTGTPLENRIDDLYSVIEFIDDRRLGPAFRFYNRHRVVDEKGKVTGYKNLAALRKALAPVLLRRTRKSVLQDLPPRTTEVVRIQPTEEQQLINDGQMRIVSSVIRKPYLNEMDLLRLQRALLMARMSADSTYLVDKEEPGYSSKLVRLRELLEVLLGEDDRKIVLFSEWTTMLNLIEKDLSDLGVQFVRLDGSVPQKKRQALVNEFRTNAECKLFITTNAGSTGLNLQAANTVINVDLPWNPALLEQRIARAHRMGQKRPVQVYVLVTEGTIEEGMLNTLSMKHELAQAALDPDSDVDQLTFGSGIEELKKRMEVLLGAVPEGPVDESRKVETEVETAMREERKARVSEAGGQMLSAAFTMLQQMLPAGAAAKTPAPQVEAVAKAIRNNLNECLETGEDGKPRLTVTLPSADALEGLAQALAVLASMGGQTEK
ncbi:MAG: superfamily II DNA or RNA helicase [Verrucomicrobiales bacterium]|jgi:superfamily II DNA or RNA helicase